MNREEAMTAFIRAGEQLQHEDDCPHAEGKWDGGCTCKTDPRRLEVSNTSAKKSEVADRTKSERKYCAIDQFYYSEMFTCPICYGAEQERERIIELLGNLRCPFDGVEHDCGNYLSGYTPDDLIDLIKGKQK